ncbi:GerMN domain-containing protein [Arthrobacter sp. KK5.5]|uniref:GerMN domain-containing protein n=1 Tax=Arthrobacter sp. KK5.5 TaxID=3373084 RepID=UPI003EE74605
MTTPKHRRRTRSRVAVLVLVASLGAVSACAGGMGVPTTTMPEGSSTTARVTPPPQDAEPLEKLSSHRLSPVYWLGERDLTVYLYREYLKAEDQGDPITSAIKYMLEHTPTDTDYFNVWSPAARIGTSIDTNNVITVDLSDDAFSRELDRGLAERAIQQLVYTATAAAANAGLLTGTTPSRVAVLVDGHTGYEAFGHIPLDGPIERVASLRAPIWVIDPQDGATRPAGKLTVRGVSAGFTGGTRWEVRRTRDGEPGEVVSQGALALGAGELPEDAFEIVLNMRPGEYRLSVWGQTAQDAERLSEDTKALTVN